MPATIANARTTPRPQGDRGAAAPQTAGGSLGSGWPAEGAGEVAGRSGAKASPGAAAIAEYRTPNLARIMDIEVPVSVILAERDMTVEQILEIAVGGIIEFEQSFESELRLTVCHRPIGWGQAVKVGENFGLRVNRVDAVRERIDALTSH